MFQISDPKDIWLLARRGKITASKASLLLSPGKGDAMFGTGALTYIKQKAIELETEVWENPKMEYVKGFLWGKQYELPAFEDYVSYTRNTDMRYLGTDTPIFFEHPGNSEAGGSPDGILGEGIKVHWILEMKCPEQSGVHWDNLDLQDQWDLKKEKIEDYTQIQMLLMVFPEADGADWVSFDARFKDKRKRRKIIQVRRDKSFQEKLDLRIDNAVILRNQLILNKLQNGY